MAEQVSAERAAVVTGLAVTSALGRGPEAQLAAALAGTAAFAPLHRFDVAGRRVRDAATLPDAGPLAAELADAVDAACADAGLDAAARADTTLMLAVHSDPGARLAAALATGAGLAGARRVYTTACVSASTAVADAATLIRLGRADRVVVAAGYLVEPDQYALFDSGKALATDGAVRPFSHGRTGLLLGEAGCPRQPCRDRGLGAHRRRLPPGAAASGGPGTGRCD